MKDEVDILDFPSLIVLMVTVDVKREIKKWDRLPSLLLADKN